MVKKGKVPVSERALFARINRVLAKEEKSLRRCREDSSSYRDCGRYYIIDIRRNYVMNTDVDLAAFAKELGLLRPFEELSD